MQWKQASHLLLEKDSLQKAEKLSPCHSSLPLTLLRTDGIDLLDQIELTMHSGLFRFQASSFQYLSFGHGPRIMVCLHGYGATADSFAFLEKQAGAHFTFVAINLPHHAQTCWKENLPFTPQALMQVVEGIFGQLLLKPEKFLLMGFSMGGRLALSLTEIYPEKIERLCLLAPDGLKTNRWYWLCTQTHWGNRLFRYTMFHPGWFRGMLQIANRLHLVNAGIFKFTHQYTDDPQVRTDLYKRWTCMRKFQPDLSMLLQKINEYQIPVRLLFGRHDRMILPVLGERMQASIKKYCSTTILDTGHRLLTEKYAESILGMMQS